MADARKSGSVAAVASWCSNNLLKKDVCNTQTRMYFKSALAASLKRQFNSFQDPEIGCVIQIDNGKPNGILEAVLKQVGVDNQTLAYSDIIVLAYRDVVWVDYNPHDFTSQKMFNECIYKESVTKK